MKTLKITNQREWDELPEKFDEFTVVEIVSKDWVIVRRNPWNAKVYAWENAKVEAWGNTEVDAWGNAKVDARGNAKVYAWGNAKVGAWGNAKVVARENANVDARDNAKVVARGNAKVDAWGNAKVDARENAKVYARGDAKVVAWGNAKIYAWDNSIVDAWDNATVDQKDSTATVRIFKSNIKKNGSVKNWLKSEFVPVKDGKVVLYKRVSKDFKTQEGTPNETTWTIGETLTVKDWNPNGGECGAGKFHACSRPYFCDEFRNETGDKYIAIEIAVKDLKAWPNPYYPHKIAFRKGKVLRECGWME